MAYGFGQAALEAAVAGSFPNDETDLSEATRAGSLVVRGAPIGRAGDWIVAGRPVSDPWGVPDDDLSCESLAWDFNRYGPAAVQLGAGPFVAVNSVDGRVVRSMSGLVPLYVSQGPPWLVATSVELVAALGGTDIRMVVEGSSISPTGTTASFGAIPADPGRCQIPWGWFQSRITDRVDLLGEFQRSSFADDVWFARSASGDAVYLPDLSKMTRHGDALRAYGEMRSALPDLWWQARLGGRWLFAPGFERPVLDTLAMLRDAQGTS